MNQAVTFEVGTLRVICAPSATDVVYAGIAMDAGTRDEHPEESGMAHLVEHMTFKGTQQRSSMQILNRMESVGADLNAFTGKEETVYYSVFMREHLARAIDLLLDIVFNSTYPQQELTKEVEVVCDEIESYNDSPAELIYDDFESQLFPDHPLGRNILGRAERLRSYSSADLKAFTQRLYLPERAVLFVMGRVKPSQVERIVTRAICHTFTDPTTSLLMPTTAQRGFPALSSPPRTRPQAQLVSTPQYIVNKPVHQAHVMAGAAALPITHPHYMAQVLLNNMLGGPGLNSRLALALRERRGLVYTVESTLTAYTDTGVWSIYFGCDPNDVRRCLRLVRNELSRLVDHVVTPRTLAAAKRQMKGQLGISYDNFENVAIGMAKRYLHYGLVTTPAEIMAQIDALTSEDLLQTAVEVFHPDNIKTLIYMPE